MKSLVIFIIGAVLLPAQALAFCGFYVGGGADLYNDATQVVMMRSGNHTALSMQNSYQGPLEDFAMVVPVPQVLAKENVKTLEKAVFDKIDRLSAPRLVEYWEQDPCSPVDDYGMFGAMGLGLRGSGRGGAGFGRGAGAVIVKARFSVAEYDIVVLETNEAAALDNWLKTNKYKIPDGAEPYFKPYIESGMYFFVAKVDVEKVKFVDGRAVLSPLRFDYKSDEFSLPVRLGMINSRGAQDLLVYILAEEQRYEVANLPNVTIPTNIDVADQVQDNFGNFYEALFSRTLEENPKAVVTEYAWQATSCDPCPTGAVGGATLDMADMKTLGADALNMDNQRALSRWTLTRLHARYSPDSVGVDLIFKKADPIVGGREPAFQPSNVISAPTSPTGIEKGATPSTFNQFQGRYAMRHGWEGKIECETPERGRWGGPPDASAMTKIRDVLVLELRRKALEAAGENPDDANLDAPLTDEESKSVAFHLRREFGTSVAPASANSGTAFAPSANTRGGAVEKPTQSLESLIREPVLGLTPDLAKVEVKPKAEPTEAEPVEPLKVAEKTKSGCSAAGGGGSWVGLLLVGFVVWRRRVRNSI